MKLLVSIICMFASSMAFAQKNSRTASSYSYSSYSSKTVSINLGMSSSALNIGARMESDSSQGALGGFFFLQTEKTDAGVPQVLSFGGHSMLKLVDASNAVAYLAPGVGVSMIKGTGGASDTTVVGPNFRYGGQIKLANGGALGLERLEVWNWFDSKAVSNAAFTSAVYSFSF